MKKQVKIISAILMIVMILTSISSIVLATSPIDDFEKATPASTDVGTTQVYQLGKTIVTILQAVGVVVAVVVILVIGIKYMMGSAQEKAEYKKTMIPYVVGAVLIFGATTIVNVVYNLANGINSAVA